MAPHFRTANTILYCRNWAQTVEFYRDRMGLPVNFSNDWFVEFCLNSGARLSIADQSRASIKSCRGEGITLALETRAIDAAWNQLRQQGLCPTRIRDHPWGARVFYLFDPEGHRVEIWQTVKAGASSVPISHER